VTSLDDFALNFVVNALWQVTLVAAVAALGSWLLLRAVSARRRYFVWVTALALSVALPFWSGLPLERETHRVIVFSAPGTVAIVSKPTGPGAIQAAPQQSGKGSLWRQLPFGRIIVGAYLLFLLYRLRKLWRAWRLTLAIRQSAAPVAAAEILQTTLAHCRTILGVGEVALFSSPSVTVPVTLGLRRPRIILPEYLLAEPSTELLRAALGHELAHIRRRDFAWNLLYEFLFLPISFHPAAALVRRRINETRELACDETVSASLMEAQPYATALVRLASSATSPNHSTYILSVNDADILEERVMKLLEKKTSVHRRRATALLGITLFALALVGAGAAALPLNFQQEAALPPNTRRVKAPQNNNPAAAARFVGTWKGVGASLGEPDPVRDEHVIIFTMEGEKLVGTYRIGPREFKPLPELRVTEKEVSWKEKDRVRQGWVYITKARLISDDEISYDVVLPFNFVGPDKALEFHPVSWTLKRQK